MNCTIRKWNMEDAQQLAALINDKGVQDNLRDGIPYPYGCEDAEFFIRETLEADPYENFAFAIAAGDQVLGSIGIFRCGNIHFRTAELGYYVGRRYWGQGVGTSAVRQACSYVFQKTDILRIFAEPFAKNSASCRVLEKAGFQLEGVLRSNAVKNGEIRDMKMYALLRQEWELNSREE